MPKKQKTEWNKEQDLKDVELLREGDFDTWARYIGWLTNQYEPEFGIMEQYRQENMTKAIWYCAKRYNGKSPFSAYVIMKMRCMLIDSYRKENHWQKMADRLRVPDDSEPIIQPYEEDWD